MDSELLRRACERAGLTFYLRDDVDPCFQLRDRLGNGPWWDVDDPALPSYVADILVGMVRELPRGASHYSATLCSVAGLGVQERLMATPEQRITAAMAAYPEKDHE